MADNNFKCSGDCLNCRMNPVERKTQWQYCASQFTYNSMRMIEAMRESVRIMQGTIDEMKAKIDAIQNSEANVFDPTQEALVDTSVSTVITQSGDGVS